MATEKSVAFFIYKNMEHFFTSVGEENWIGCETLYTSMVNKCNSGSKFVEVGTWKGRSACYMAVEIINSGKDICFDCVDTWKYVPTSTDSIGIRCFEGLYEKFLKNIEPVREKINIVRTLSWEAANQYNDGSVDFVYIDASHDYISVMKDLKAWFPKIKNGGIISGHDYPLIGVFSAVNEFFTTEKQKITQEGYNWVVEKNN